MYIGYLYSVLRILPSYHYPGEAHVHLIICGLTNEA